MLDLASFLAKFYRRWAIGGPYPCLRYDLCRSHHVPIDPLTKPRDSGSVKILLRHLLTLLLQNPQNLQNIPGGQQFFMQQFFSRLYKTDVP